MHDRTTLLAFLRKRCGKPLNSAQRAALDAADLSSNGEELILSRAQGNATGGAGGYTVPQSFSYRLEAALKLANPLRTVAQVLTTPDGRALPWPLTDDTANSGQLLAENTVEPSATAVAFSSVTLGAYKFTSGMLKLSNELVEDSGLDIAQEIARLAGLRIGRAEAPYFLNGTGTAQPRGFLQDAPAVSTGTANTLTWDDVIALKHSVDPAVRAMGAAFLMSDAIFATLTKQKNSSGQYFYFAGTGGGSAVPHIDGDPVVIFPSMSGTVATGNTVAAYGDFSRFVVRDVGELRVSVLNELYADYDQVGVVVRRRTDSRLLDAGQHPVKVLQVS